MKKSNCTKWILIISLLMLPFQIVQSDALKTISPASVMSFGEWKQHTKRDIQDRMISLKSKISDQKILSKNFIGPVSHGNTVESNKQNADVLSSRLRNEKIRLEASEDLTFHEYFVSYLMLQKDLDKKIAELAKTLKPEEISELMASYGDIVNKMKDEGKHGYNSMPLDD